jgi:hypothetical protein
LEQSKYYSKHFFDSFFFRRVGRSRRKIVQVVVSRETTVIKVCKKKQLGIHQGFPMLDFYACVVSN